MNKRKNFIPAPYTCMQDQIKLNDINELHNSVIELSKSSFEYKKLCITTVGIVLAFMFTKNDFFNRSLSYVIPLCIILLITVTFHLCDSISFYYQRKNRFIQNILKEKLILNEEKTNTPIFKLKKTKALFNSSMLMYFLIYSIVLLVAGYLRISFILYIDYHPSVGFYTASTQELLNIFYSSFTDTENINITLHTLTQNMGPIDLFTYLYSKEKSLVIIILFEFIIVAAIWVFFWIFNRKKEKIFIGYTTRLPHGIQKEILHIAKFKLKKYDTYIDIVDGEKNSDWQENIYTNLRSSTLVIFINTQNLLDSEWVKKEVDLANIYQKRIIYLDFDYMPFVPVNLVKLIKKRIKG